MSFRSLEQSIAPESALSIFSVNKMLRGPDTLTTSLSASRECKPHALPTSAVAVLRLAVSLVMLWLDSSSAGFQSCSEIVSSSTEEGAFDTARSIVIAVLSTDTFRVGSIANLHMCATCAPCTNTDRRSGCLENDSDNVPAVNTVVLPNCCRCQCQSGDEEFLQPCH